MNLRLNIYVSRELFRFFLSSGGGWGESGPVVFLGHFAYSLPG